MNFSVEFVKLLKNAFIRYHGHGNVWDNTQGITKIGMVYYPKDACGLERKEKSEETLAVLLKLECAVKKEDTDQ